MVPVFMGGLSAASLGVADFIASQNSKRIGAARSLAGMLMVSSVFLTLFMLSQGDFGGLFQFTNLFSILLASLHGVTMAIALLLFFYAMSVGKISVIAPIVAAHPLVIVAFHAGQGAHLTLVQLASVLAILFGVALVGAAGGKTSNASRETKRYAAWHVVAFISLAASLIYGIAIVFVPVIPGVYNCI